MIGIERRGKAKNSEEFLNLKMGIIPERYKWGLPTRVLQLLGEMPHTEKGKITNEYSQRYDKSRWRFLLDAPFPISNRCCAVMKKSPIKKYSKQTGRYPITAQMAEESILRQSVWLKNGCNAFEAKNPISNPMSFWTEQDVLKYIRDHNLQIASVYGDIIYDDGEEITGQMDIADFGLSEDIRSLKTTGCSRTGCMFCGYGCHLEKSPNRFEKMKETHPKQYEYIMKPTSEGGLGYKEIIDWINENGKLNIKY